MENNMNFQLSSSVNDGILEIIITGELKESSINKIYNKVDNIIKANGVVKAIWDFRAFKGRVDKTEFYRLVRNHPSVFYEIQAAIVDLPENTDYETAARNAGLSIKWFTDIDTARAWIKNK